MAGDALAEVAGRAKSGRAKSGRAEAVHARSGQGRILAEASLPRTLDALAAALGRLPPGSAAEAWLFEDEAPRRRAEAVLAERGVRARFRSAYKPLVHAFLEEFAVDGLVAAAVAYPVEDGADPLRFQLETYPLGALIGGAALRFRPGGPGLTYGVELVYASGQVARHRVFAPNRLRLDPAGEPALSPCGWLRVRGGPDGPVETEAEAAFDAVLAALQLCPLGEGPPLPRLRVEVACPGIERGLPGAGEAMSLAEALHEDLFFSAHEALARRAGRVVGDRSFQPGQVVPVVEARPGEARVRVTLLAHAREPEPAGWAGPLDEALAPPSLARIADEVAALGGQRLAARSVQGREVAGAILPGPGPAVLVTAGQHGNETSGVVGLLRAARRLAGRAAVGLIPVENPDGYALHGQLCLRQPDHIHHAARLTALGDDVEARRAEPLWEAAARIEALQRTGAGLHVNLHGYPAHEWTRPFTGYVPRGFAAWTIPGGFFLILRHRPGWGERATALLEAVAAEVAAVPGLVAFNGRQIALGEAHGSPPPGPLRHGVPCVLAEEERAGPPLTLITEFPDETLTGDAFRFAHEVQMRAVLAAVRHWQETSDAPAGAGGPGEV